MKRRTVSLQQLSFFFYGSRTVVDVILFFTHCSFFFISGLHILVGL